MTYQLQKTRPSDMSRGKKIFLAVFFVVIILIIFFFRATIFPFLSSYTQKAITPFLKSGAAVGNATIDNLPLLRSKSSLVKENNILKERLGAINSRLLTYELLTEENLRLKSILDRSEDRDSVLATVIAKPNKTPYDTMVLDIGLNKGIKEGDEVLIFEQSVIGTIKEVYSNTSKVVMFSSPGEKTSVLIGKSGIQGEALGRGAGNFEINLPKDVEVKVGDIVTVPSLNIKILGVVENIEFSSGGTFAQLLIKSPVNINELRWVEVLRSSNEETPNIEADEIPEETEPEETI